MNEPILSDIHHIIKMPSGIKCIGINRQDNDKESSKGKEVSPAWRQ
jgi:hypothetical protein